MNKSKRSTSEKIQMAMVVLVITAILSVSLYFAGVI
jgi:hypothetical protein